MLAISQAISLTTQSSSSVEYTTSENALPEAAPHVTPMAATSIRQTNRMALAMAVVMPFPGHSAQLIVEQAHPSPRLEISES
jgi:hypothetical protein